MSLWVAGIFPKAPGRREKGLSIPAQKPGKEIGQGGAPRYFLQASLVRLRTFVGGGPHPQIRLPPSGLVCGGGGCQHFQAEGRCICSPAEPHSRPDGVHPSSPACPSWGTAGLAASPNWLAHGRCLLRECPESLSLLSEEEDPPQTLNHAVPSAWYSCSPPASA